VPTLNAVLLATLGLLVAGCHVRGASAPTTRRGYDPVTMDPPARDSVHPARLAELAFESAGARLNGIFYLPAGPGPHPVVTLLHGNPGNERNLDVAQALRRAGYATLYFNYRGSWASGGTFSRTHALEDVRAALRFVRSPLAAERYRVDSARVALVGHSMGGWLALLAAAGDPRIGCVGALDFVNTGARGRRLLRDGAADSARTVEDTWLTAPGGPYRAEGGGPALVAEVKANAARWDVLTFAPALRERRVLLVGSANRTEHDSLVTALGGPQAPRLTAHWWPTDHSFSDRRIALTRAILDWLRGPCGL
jgi:pimeloyl-ACP methyl ester carboxylesterase